MGALTIAFDITIVGALALPWVLIVIQLFFLEGENRLDDALNRVKDLGQPAAVGVLLFAVTYTLGSAVSRTAQDFFDDDDLHVEIGGHTDDRRTDDRRTDDRGAQTGGHLFRVGVTEGRIRTQVYCDSSKSRLLSDWQASPVLLNAISTFQKFPDRETLCGQTLSWSVSAQTNWQDDELNQDAEHLFGLQENTLMVKGGDYTVRLRQLHDQIMVLRGAAFNGFVGFSLCLFACGAKFRIAHHEAATLRRAKGRGSKLWSEQLGFWMGWALVPIPVFYLAVAVIATVHHFGGRQPSDPPYMEFTLFLLWLAGAWLVWRPPSWQSKKQAEANHVQAGDVQEKKTEAGKEKGNGTKWDWRIEHWAHLAVLSAILTTAAILGWWSTEKLYAEQVIYSYDTQASQSTSDSGTTASR